MAVHEEKGSEKNRYECSVEECKNQVIRRGFSNIKVRQTKTTGLEMLRQGRATEPNNHNVAARKDARIKSNEPASLLCNVKECACQPTVEECNGDTRLHTIGAYT
eukprot:scaffold1077_cov168-Skeletonema_dohrnii-CCMP3373.AAC.2